jgi:arylsulfatase A-like enzyme
MDPRISRRQLLAGLGAMGAAHWLHPAFAWASAEKAARPNVLFIMSDDHAAHALSCYGSRTNKTPQLDRIAAEGMRFDHCFCTNSLCAPSRAAFLTGKYSHLNGVKDNRDVFDAGQPTFPGLLQDAGYQTALVGKWHLKSDPSGFDFWDILPGQGEYYDPVMIKMGERRKLDGYVTDLITDAAIGFLDRRDKTRPFCLLVHHKAPHRRWQPGPKYVDLYADADIPTPETFNDDYSGRSAPARLAEMRIADHLDEQDTKGAVPENLTPEEAKHWKYQRYIKDYLRCIASIDANVGRLLDYLDQSDLTDSTVVVYTSDQGFFLGDHGWFDKRFMYEESLRMPLLVRYPRLVKPGSVTSGMVLNVDLAPTLLELGGAPLLPAMQGRSIVPLLEGHLPEDWRTAAYYHYYEYPAVHSVRPHYGIRTDRYKLIRYYGDVDEWEFFDLEKDPRELRSVYADPEYARTVATLKDELAHMRRVLADDTGPAMQW